MNNNYKDELFYDAFEKMNSKNYLKKKDLTFKVVYEGVLLPAVKNSNDNSLFGRGGVMDRNGKYISESALKAYNMSNRIQGGYFVPQKDIEIVDEEVIYLGYFMPHWGHFLLDFLSRVWCCKTNKYKGKYAYIIDRDSTVMISGVYREFFDLLGIPRENLLVINKPTRFSKIIVPEQSIYPGKWYTKEYVDTFDSIRDKVEKQSQYEKNIYLSRTKLKFGRYKEIGEKRIERFFRRNGYCIVYPEKLSLIEQIAVFKSAKELACVSGTLPHNMLFSENGSKLTIIHKTYRLNKHQFLINQMRKLSVTNIDAHLSLFPVLYGAGPFVLFETENLRKFAIDRNYSWSKGIGITNKIRKAVYICWYIVKYIRINTVMPNVDIFNEDDDLKEHTEKELYDYYRKTLF